MNINRENVLEKIEELRNRDETKRGSQPIATLECWYGRGMKDSQICARCGFYWNCGGYLEAFKREK